MMVLRILGQVFTLMAIGFLGLGVFVWLDGRAMEPLGKIWFDLHLPSLNYAEVVVSRHLNMTEFWRDQVLPFLQCPAWEALLWIIIVLLLSGGILMFLGRGRRRRRHPSGFGN